jgi:hypothetical protein
MTTGKNIVKNCASASIIGTSTYCGVIATASWQRRKTPMPMPMPRQRPVRRRLASRFSCDVLG